MVIPVNSGTEQACGALFPSERRRLVEARRVTSECLLSLRSALLTTAILTDERNGAGLS